MHWPEPLRVPPELNDTGAPDALVCPITQCLMTEPVLVTSSGRTYEREAIERWIREHHTDPLDSNQRLELRQLAPNLAVRQMVEAFVRENLPGGAAAVRVPAAVDESSPAPSATSAPSASTTGAAGTATPRPLPVPSVDAVDGRRAPLAAAAVRVPTATCGGSGLAPHVASGPLPGDDDPLEGGTLRVGGLWMPQSGNNDGNGQTPDGKYFKFSRARLRALIRMNGDERWALHGMLREDKLLVKGDEGGVLRARNERTGKQSAVLLFKQSAEWGVGCWNPSDYAAPG